MDIERTPVNRRTVLVGASAVAAAATVVGCAANGTKEPVPSTPPVGLADQSGPVVATVSEIPVGGGKVIADQQLVVTQPSAGDFRGFSAVCTHQACQLSSVSGGTINCPCHGSRFNLDGSVANGPAMLPLLSRPVRVQGNSIVLA